MGSAQHWDPEFLQNLKYYLNCTVCFHVTFKNNFLTVLMKRNVHFVNMNQNYKKLLLQVHKMKIIMRSYHQVENNVHHLYQRMMYNNNQVSVKQMIYYQLQLHQLTIY